MAASIKEAKVICSQATLDAWIACSQLILEAKTNFIAAVKKAKTTRGHLVQEAKAACSKAICKVEAWKVSQAVMFQTGTWKVHARTRGANHVEEESRSHNDFLSACQVVLYNSPPQLRGALATSYHLILGQAPLLPPLILPQKDFSHGRTANSQPLPPHQHPDNLLGSKGDTLCWILWRAHAYGWNHPKGYSGRTPLPQEVRDHSLVQNTQAQPC